ncbi:MAG: YiiX/YebB-like N1pC/P60 family cysteine hydrolase [bacterium]
MKNIILILIQFIFSYVSLTSEENISTDNSEKSIQNIMLQLITLDNKADSLKQYIDKFFIPMDSLIYNPIPKAQRKVIKDLWAQFNDLYFSVENINNNCQIKLKSKQYKKIREILIFYSYAISYDIGLFIIERTLNKPHYEILLDESQPEYSIPSGRYADLKFQVLHSNYLIGFTKNCTKTIKDIDKLKSNDSLFQKIKASLERKFPYISKMRHSLGKIYFLRNFADFMTDFQQRLLMPLQKVVLDFFGDTRLTSRHTGIINNSQCDTLKTILQPGDLLFERKEWYLSNIGIPGFWPHSALYIGNYLQLEKWSDDPGIEEYYRTFNPEFSDFPFYLKNKYPAVWEKYIEPDSTGELNCIMEAIGEGVVLHNIYESIGASDYIAALRPKLSKKDIAQAIEQAFQYHGRDYDFNFDFFSDNELVCSELVFKAYEKDKNKDGLDFDLAYVMGKLTLAPNSMIAQYCKDTSSSKLSFVTFYDADEEKGIAFPSNFDEFKYSYFRPRWGYAPVTFKEDIEEGDIELTYNQDRKTKYYYMPVNVSLTLSNSLGIMFSDGKEIINYLSLNIFSGKAAKLRGFELGTIWNYNSEYMNGVQICGIMNTVIEDSYGVQIAGLLNVNASEFYGFQLSGLANFTGSIVGVQASLLTNSCEKLYGFQIAPLLNTALDKSNGVQLGLMNISKNMRNSQFGFINTAGEMQGVQIGFANGSLNVKQGVQLGLFNITKENHAVPIALFSYVDDVPVQYRLWFDEIPSVNIGVVSGNKLITNRLFFSEFMNSSESHAIGWGAGLVAGDWEFGTVDLGFNIRHLFRSGDKFLQLNDIFQLSVTTKINLWNKFALLIGPTFNYYYSEKYDFVDVKYFELNTGRHSDNIFKSWIGLNLGFSY